MTIDVHDAPRRVRPAAAAARLVTVTVAFGAMLFVLAGSVRWPAAWGYLALATGILGVYAVIVATRHPELIQERLKPPADAKKWDKLFVALIAGVAPAATIALCGLDRRFRWSPLVPIWAKAAGFVLYALGGGLTCWAVASNRFFSALVRIQRDRGHRVVDSGPYRLVRHPGYVGSVLATLGMPLILGSIWGLALSGAVVALIAVRTGLEDRTLRAELDGYADYAGRVRYRLVPGIW